MDQTRESEAPNSQFINQAENTHINQFQEQRSMDQPQFPMSEDIIRLKYLKGLASELSNSSSLYLNCVFKKNYDSMKNQNGELFEKRVKNLTTMQNRQIDTIQAKYSQNLRSLSVKYQNMSETAKINAQKNIQFTYLQSKNSTNQRYNQKVVDLKNKLKVANKQLQINYQNKCQQNLKICSFISDFCQCFQKFPQKITTKYLLDKLAFTLIGLSNSYVNLHSQQMKRNQIFSQGQQDQIQMSKLQSLDLQQQNKSGKSKQKLFEEAAQILSGYNRNNESPSSNQNREESKVGNLNDNQTLNKLVEKIRLEKEEEEQNKQDEIVKPPSIYGSEDLQKRLEAPDDFTQAMMKQFRQEEKNVLDELQESNEQQRCQKPKVESHKSEQKMQSQSQNKSDPITKKDEKSLVSDSKQEQSHIKIVNRKSENLQEKQTNQSKSQKIRNLPCIQDRIKFYKGSNLVNYDEKKEQVMQTQGKNQSQQLLPVPLQFRKNIKKKGPKEETELSVNNEEKNQGQKLQLKVHKQDPQNKQ